MALKNKTNIKSVKKYAKIAPGVPVDRCEKEFMHLDYHDITLLRPLQIFKTNYYISLKTIGINKQTNKQPISLNCLTEVENTEYIPQKILLARNRMSNHILPNDKRFTLLYFLGRHFQIILNPLMYFMYTEVVATKATLSRNI